MSERDRQQIVLEKMARRQSSSQQLVRRVQIIRNSAQGKNNQQVAQAMGIHRETVSHWRECWLEATKQLSTVESKADDKQLMQCIESVLADELRPGTPARFSLEQIVEILAIACETPDASDYPISQNNSKFKIQNSKLRLVRGGLNPPLIEDHQIEDYGGGLNP